MKVMLCLVLPIIAAVFAVYADELEASESYTTDSGTTFMVPPQDLMFKMVDQIAFHPLFEKDLSNAIFEETGWAFEDDVLVAKGKGDIWTMERYDDFILSLEFKCAADTNSGVFLRCGDLEDWMHTTIEVQILQNNEAYENAKWHCGAIFDFLEPIKQLVLPPGEWNTYLIIAKDNLLWVFLNQELATFMDMDNWTEPGTNPDGTRNKFRDALKGMPRSGHIGLQYHGQPVSFRNIQIQPLD